jgi:hypothetical protein
MPNDFETYATKAVESRAEVDCLEELQAKRREIIEHYAPLAVRFQGGNTRLIDAIRKQHRAIVSKKILSELPAGSKEPSEVALERMANAHPDHIAFVEGIESDGVAYIQMQNAITEIEEKIQSRQTEMNIYNTEIKLAR